VEKTVAIEMLKQAERVGWLSYGRLSSFAEGTQRVSVGFARKCETARILVLYPRLELPIVQNAPTSAPKN
jgi:hypothetical protein